MSNKEKKQKRNPHKWVTAALITYHIAHTRGCVRIQGRKKHKMLLIAKQLLKHRKCYWVLPRPTLHPNQTAECCQSILKQPLVLIFLVAL